MILRFMLASAAIALAMTTNAQADKAARGYESAVSCKALSELASNANDEASKTAIAHIDAAIDRQISAGKSRAEADADIDYARANWNGANNIALVQSEWRKCVTEWRD